MVKLKKIFFLSFIITGIYAAEQNKINMQVMSLDESDENSNARSLPMITLIDKEGTHYSVPRRVAMGSKFLEAILHMDSSASEVPVEIPKAYFQPLINALVFIQENKKKFTSSKEFYKQIQENLSLQNENMHTLHDVGQLLHFSNYLDSSELMNAIADYFAQLLIKELYTVNQIIDIILPEHWFLIEKYYYLRSSEQKIKAEKLLFVQNEKLTSDLFNFYFKKVPAEFNMQYIGEKIIYDMNLSVQDLLDYDKLIAVSFIGNLLALDLSKYGLRSLYGLNNVDDIERVQSLYLVNNQLRELPEGIFNGLNNLQFLNLSGNQLRELSEGIFNSLNNLRWLDLLRNQLRELPESIFNGLNNLEWLNLFNNQLRKLPEGIFNGLNLQLLDLSNNQLRKLPEGIFNGLNNLHHLYLDNNQLSEQAKIVIQQFKQQHPIVDLRL